MDVLDPKRAANRKLLSGSGPQLNLKYRIKVCTRRQYNSSKTTFKEEPPDLRTFARNFSNIDFFLKILPLKDDELAMSEM